MTGLAIIYRIHKQQLTIFLVYFFFVVVSGSHLAMLRDCFWLCFQESLWCAWGIIWTERNKTHVNWVQGKRPTFCSIALAPPLDYLLCIGVLVLCYLCQDAIVKDSRHYWPIVLPAWFYYLFAMSQSRPGLHTYVACDCHWATFLVPSPQSSHCRD